MEDKMKGYEEIKTERNLYLILLIGIVFLFFVLCFMHVSLLVKTDTSIRYIHTGTDYADAGYSEQYFIRYLVVYNGKIKQIEMTASSEEEAGLIVRYMRGE